MWRCGCCPTLNEYFTIQSCDQQDRRDQPQLRSARSAPQFDKQKEIEYSIASISGKDLDITKENDRIVIRFAYNKELELIAPVYLLIKYEGRSR